MGILVSENIVKAVDIAIYPHEIDRVRVRGEARTGHHFEPAGLKAEVVNQEIDDIDRFHRALDKYRAQAWDEAEAGVACAVACRRSERSISSIFRAFANCANPPGANWDGVFVRSHTSSPMPIDIRTLRCVLQGACVIAYPFENPPAPGETLEVAPACFGWMPLPFKPDHINLWLLRDDDARPGWTIVDTGYAVDLTRSLWDQHFAAILKGSPVKRVIVTHFHPDHVGCARWLSEKPARWCG